MTVVGPGGAGKTRLALEVAGDAVAAYADGVWFVDLAAVTDPYLVAVAVAEVLGVRPEPGRPILETIADYVGRAQPAARARHLRRPPERGEPGGGPAARRPARAYAVLATSREPLGCAGRVGLADPADEPVRAGRRRPPDAVALLVDRAAAARGGRRAGAGRDDPPAAGGPAPGRAAARAGAGRRPAAAVLGRRSSPTGSRTCSAPSTPARPEHGRVPDRRRSRPAPAQHAAGDRGLVVPHAAARRRRPAAPAVASSPARSTWPPSSGSPARTRWTGWPCSWTSR